MVVCFRSISARTSEGIGTFNCWCCWRIGLCFDVEKRLGSGVDTTHATPASLGCPRRRIDTASRVSKSTPCVRCVQPWARRRVSPCARRRLPMLSVRLPTEQSGGSATAARVSNRCRACGLSRARGLRSSVVHFWCCPRVLPGRGQRRCRLSRCDPSRKSGTILLREPVRRVFAPGSSSGGGTLVPRLLVGRGQLGTTPKARRTVPERQSRARDQSSPPVAVDAPLSSRPRA